MICKSIENTTIYLPTHSRLRVENFDLTPTHAYETNFSRLVEKTWTINT